MRCRAQLTSEQAEIYLRTIETDSLHEAARLLGILPGILWYRVKNSGLPTLTLKEVKAKEAVRRRQIESCRSIRDSEEYRHRISLIQKDPVIQYRIKATRNGLKGLTFPDGVIEAGFGDEFIDYVVELGEAQAIYRTQYLMGLDPVPPKPAKRRGYQPVVPYDRAERMIAWLAASPPRKTWLTGAGEVRGKRKHYAYRLRHKGPKGPYKIAVDDAKHLAIMKKLRGEGRLLVIL